MRDYRDWKRRKPDDDDADDAPPWRRRRRSADARSLADARAEATRSYHQMCRRLQDAWRSRTGVARPEPAIIGAGPRGMVVETRASGEPDANTRPLRTGGEPDVNNAEGMMRRHLRGDVMRPDADARERAIAQRNARLERAWRGQTHPNRAENVEAERERWLGK